MCEDCKQIVVQAQNLIEAIDQNREALNQVLDQIHHDMGDRFVLDRDAEGHTRPMDFTKNALGRVVLANYVAAFLAGEAPMLAEESIGIFYNTGYEHGSAYAGARQLQLN